MTLVKSTEDIPEHTRDVLAALQRVKDATPLPNPSRVESIALVGTYQGPEPPDATGVVVKAAYADPETIPTEQQAFAERHAETARRMLGLGPITIRWFRITDDEHADIAFVTLGPGQVLGGSCNSEEPGVIQLNAGIQPSDTLAGVIAHEVRHAQQQAMLALLAQNDFRESDANAFAALYTGRGR